MTKDYPPKDLSKKELVEMALKLQEESTARKQKLAKMESEIEEITRASSGKENKEEEKEESDEEKAKKLSAQIKAEQEARENADKGKEGSRYNFLWQEVRGDSDLAYTYKEGIFPFEINGKETEVTVYENKTEWKKHSVLWKITRLKSKKEEETFKERPTWVTYVITENKELDKKYPREYEFETKEEAIAFAEKIIDDGMKIKNKEENRFMPKDEIKILNTFPPYAYVPETKPASQEPTATETSPEPTPPLTPEKKTITPIEETTQILEAKEKLEKARENYINEYKKCKKEAQKQTLIDKTRNTTFNILAGIKNLTRKEKIKYHKEVIKPENYFTKEAIDAKNAYAKAKIEMGNEMFNQKKTELEKAGLAGDELRQALEQYKAVEILGKTIIDERQKVIEAKAEKPALLKRLLDSYLKIKPKWKRVALSTLVFLPLAASGALGASAIAAGGIYGGIAGLAVVKFTASMLIGGVVGHAAKGIDWAKKGSDLKFAQNQYDKKIELQGKFSKGEVSSEEYEKEIDNLEEAEKKRNRNRLILKGVVGAALAITAGYFAYDAMGNGLTHLEGTENHIDTINGPDEGSVKPGATFDNNTKTGIKDGTVVNNNIKGGGGAGNDIKDGTETGAEVNIKHEAVEATANNGQGAISTIRELQENLKLEYKDSLENAPVSVKHILETDAHKLAQEFGMYKPGEDAESLLIKSGSSFKIDGSGNLSFHDVDSNSDVTLIKGTELKAYAPYEGRMVDTDHSGVRAEINRLDNENIIDNPNFNEGVKTPEVAPKIIDLNSTNENTIGAPDIKEIASPQVEPKIIDLNNSDLKTNADEVSANLLSTEELNETKINYLRNLFPTEKSMSNWNHINNKVSAEKLIELSDNKQINVAYEPLSLHIKNLQELSGLDPYKATEFQPAESISHFMNRAYGEINELGKIKDIEVFDNSNLETGTTNIKMANLEEIIKSTKGVYEANIDHLKDLKEITKGYEGLPGQLPIKMIMENVSGKGLHSIVSEDIAGTKTAAMMSSNFKMNNIMSTVGGKTYHDYYFDKVLPNGNIKLIHIKFYK